MSETPIVTFSSLDNPNTWGVEGESKRLVFASPSEAKRAEELFTAMQRALTAERERADMAKAEGIKEGMRRAAEIANAVGQIGQASAEGTVQVDPMAKRISVAILKEAGE